MSSSLNVPQIVLTVIDDKLKHDAEKLNRKTTTNPAIKKKFHSSIACVKIYFTNDSLKYPKCPIIHSYFSNDHNANQSHANIV